jgi:hypothetical protein
MNDLLHNILFIATAEMILALVVVMLIRTRQRLMVGTPERSERGSRDVLFLLLPIVLGVLLASSLQGDLPVTVLAPGLLAAAAMLLIQPKTGANTLGETGVAVGWRTRKFQQFEEWRLMGDHLRVFAGGEWRAIAVPVAEHTELRKRLESLCPEKESRFKT